MLIFANETEKAKDLTSINTWLDKVFILVGPEGGFSNLEIQEINALEQACSVSLGPYRLRSELAAVALLSQILLFRKR
jgi:16S rRNA (uracil1498-N3)-methyltransferase